MQETAGSCIKFQEEGIVTAKGKGFFRGQAFSFELPVGWNLLAMAEPKEKPGLADVEAAVLELLANLNGMAPLTEVVAALPHKKTVIISEDQTRPTVVGQILIPLLNELNRLGIPDGQVDVIIGRGTHRLPTDAELEAKLGSRVLDRLRVTIHDADDGEFVHVGITSRGTRVYVNRLVAEAALVIGIGTTNPHYFAGYSGGPKLILPGVCSRETIKQNHVLIDDPRANAGIMEGNPVWEDMMEAARLARLTVKFDVLLNADKEIVKIYGGEVEAQQRAAIEGLKEMYGVAVPDRADVTITSGHPLEVNLIQSGKAILLADTVTKPGGTIVLLASCPSGAGPLMYETLSQRPAPDQVIQWIAEGKANPTGGPMASRLRKLVQSKNLIVVTEGLTPQQLDDMEFGYAPSVDDALNSLAGGNGKRDVIVLPVGGSTFPYLA
jgi:nickel-dependent lactate racemase